MKKELKEIQITDYGYSGEGVGRIDGKVCFVNNALKNEKLLVSIIKENSSYMKGEIVQILQNSPDREKPPCKYFGLCGGCSYQHLSYEKELEIKKEILRARLSKIGYNNQINLIPNPNPYNYRNKIKLFVCDNKIGLKKRESSVIVDIDKCLLVDNLINNVIEKIRHFVEQNNKLVENIVLRQENSQILINFILKKDVKLDYSSLCQSLGDNFGILQTYKGKIKHIFGLNSLKVNEMGLLAEFNVDSFHQVNNFLTKDLYLKVIENIKGDWVINCYSGAGTLSGILAKSCEKVVGIELGLSEHKDAEKLKRINNLLKLTNICGDCALKLTSVQGDFNTIIVDPPRAGLDKKVVDAIINCKRCERMIYISCDSSTLTRDLNILKKCFSMKEVYLFDMFSRTSEFETLVILDRIKT